MHYCRYKYKYDSAQTANMYKGHLYQLMVAPAPVYTPCSTELLDFHHMTSKNNNSVKDADFCWEPIWVPDSAHIARHNNNDLVFMYN